MAGARPRTAFAISISTWHRLPLVWLQRASKTHVLSVQPKESGLKHFMALWALGYFGNSQYFYFLPSLVRTTSEFFLLGGRWFHDESRHLTPRISMFQLFQLFQIQVEPKTRTSSRFFHLEKNLWPPADLSLLLPFHGRKEAKTTDVPGRTQLASFFRWFSDVWYLKSRDID